MIARFSNINDVVDFINNRALDLGNDIKTAGWSSQESQDLRFDYLCRDFDLSGKTMLDVGCGKGDLIRYLGDRDVSCFNYFGVDISYQMINLCQQNFNLPNTTFIHGNIFDRDFPDLDIAILSGALSYKYDQAIDNARRTMKRMFEISREGIAINFLSKVVDFELEKNQHYDPAVILNWSLELTRNVTLYHSYPLYEFTVILKK